MTTKAVWPVEPRIFTICPFTERICPPPFTNLQGPTLLTGSRDIPHPNPARQHSSSPSPRIQNIPRHSIQQGVYNP